MNKKTMSSLLSIVAISALTIGCGNSSTTPETTAQEKTSGTVIDDYIKDATVCVDVNNDGKRDSGDTPCTVTNATGQFTFTTDVSASPLVMSGGIDVGKVAPDNNFTGTYSAPAGSTVVNPLTTIVQAIVKSSGKSVAEAQTIVKTSLGIPQALDLSTYDPIAVLSTGTPAEIKEAKDVFAQQSSIQTILTTVASTIAASVGTATNEDDVTSGAAAQIAALMNVATPAVIIINSTTITSIINTTAVAANTTVDTRLAAAIAAQVVATSTQVITDITTSTGTIGDIRQAAAQVAVVVQANAAIIVAAVASGVTTAIEQATDDLATNIGQAAANVTPAASLTTVASEASAPTATVTGAEGGN